MGLGLAWLHLARLRYVRSQVATTARLATAQKGWANTQSATSVPPRRLTVSLEALPEGLKFTSQAQSSKELEAVELLVGSLSLSSLVLVSFQLAVLESLRNVVVSRAWRV